MEVEPELQSPTRRLQVRFDQDSGLPLDNVLVLGGLQVLVVDDEAAVRALLTTVFNQYGAAVTAVASVAEALDALQQSLPDILVSDIEMPVEDGYALIRKVRAFHPQPGGGGIPAIALTPSPQPLEQDRARRAGFQLCVPKPFKPTEIVATVALLARPATTI